MCLADTATPAFSPAAPLARMRRIGASGQGGFTVSCGVAVPQDTPPGCRLDLVEARFYLAANAGQHRSRLLLHHRQRAKVS
jgi:hypothetical protein